MSARLIVSLALVALVAFQANSLQADQLAQESVQAQPQKQLSMPVQQLVSGPSSQQTLTTSIKTEAAPAQQQLYGLPATTAQTLASTSSPAQTTFETTPALPVVSAVVPSKAQSFNQQPAQVYSYKGGQALYQQEQRLEAAPVRQSLTQAPVAEQVSFAAPSKGQSFNQQPAQVFSSKGGQSFYQQERLPAQQLESAPLKGAQTYSAKSHWVAPARQDVTVAQQPLPVLTTPMKTQAVAFDYQTAPAKAYSYRARQPLRSPFKGQQQYVARPAVLQSHPRA